MKEVLGTGRKLLGRWRGTPSLYKSQMSDHSATSQFTTLYKAGAGFRGTWRSWSVWGL